MFFVSKFSSRLQSVLSGQELCWSFDYMGTFTFLLVVTVRKWLLCCYMAVVLNVIVSNLTNAGVEAFL